MLYHASLPVGASACPRVRVLVKMSCAFARHTDNDEMRLQYQYCWLPTTATTAPGSSYNCLRSPPGMIAGSRRGGWVSRHTPVQGQILCGLQALLSQSRTCASRSSWSSGRSASWIDVLCSFSHFISGLDMMDQSTREVWMGTCADQSGIRQDGGCEEVRVEMCVKQKQRKG